MEPEFDLSTLPGDLVQLLTPDLALKLNPVVVQPSKVCVGVKCGNQGCDE